jgi:hypothetical protein
MFETDYPTSAGLADYGFSWNAFKRSPLLCRPIASYQGSRRQAYGTGLRHALASEFRR